MQENEGLTRVMKGEEYYVDSKKRRQGPWVLTRGNRGTQTCNYKNDRMHGEFKRVSSKGVLLESVMYVNGERNGLHFECYANKQKISEKNYKDGRICGEVIIYGNAGATRSRHLEVDGKVIKHLEPDEVLDPEDELVYALKYPGFKFIRRDTNK